MEAAAGFRNISPCVPSHRYIARRALVVLWSCRAVEEKERDDCAALENCFAQDDAEERVDGHRNGGGILGRIEVTIGSWNGDCPARERG